MALQLVLVDDQHQRAAIIVIGQRVGERAVAEDQIALVQRGLMAVLADHQPAAHLDMQEIAVLVDLRGLALGAPHRGGARCRIGESQAAVIRAKHLRVEFAADSGARLERREDVADDVVPV